MTGVWLRVQFEDGTLAPAVYMPNSEAWSTYMDEDGVSPTVEEHAVTLPIDVFLDSLPMAVKLRWLARLTAGDPPV